MKTASKIGLRSEKVPGSAGFTHSSAGLPRAGSSQNVAGGSLAAASSAATYCPQDP